MILCGRKFNQSWKFSVNTLIIISYKSIKNIYLRRALHPVSSGRVHPQIEI